jgi:hypothetical protein
MDRERALHKFWSSFGVPAYDSSTVPDDAPLPRITYEVQVNGWGEITLIYGSIWMKSTGWKEITSVADKIDSRLSEGGQTIRYDDGMLWIKKGSPFMQRMSDPDDTIRRILVNIEVEYLEGKR